MVPRGSNVFNGAADYSPSSVMTRLGGTTNGSDRSTAGREGDLLVTPPVHHPEPLVWLSPCFGFPDWIELYTILSFGADMPVPLHLSSGNYALPMAAGQATHRSLLLLFAHQVPARQMTVSGGGRRAAPRNYVQLTAGSYSQILPSLTAARDRLGRGSGWLDASGDATGWALAQWRGLLLSGSWVRTRDSSMILRVAQAQQAAALHASAQAIGFEVRRECGRRETRHRLVIEGNSVPTFLHRVALEARSEAMVG